MWILKKTSVNFEKMWILKMWMLWISKKCDLRKNENMIRLSRVSIKCEFSKNAKLEKKKKKKKKKNINLIA